MDLSLTGSQVSVGHSARRPNSAKGRRPPTTTATRSSHVGKGSGAHAPASARSDVSGKGTGRRQEPRASPAWARPAHKQDTPTSPQDDFLALFENSTSSGVGARPKQKHQSRVEPLNLKANAGLSARSTSSTEERSTGGHQKKRFSHSVFQPSSVRSNSTMDGEEPYVDPVPSPLHGHTVPGEELPLENGLSTRDQLVPNNRLADSKATGSDTYWTSKLTDNPAKSSTYRISSPGEKAVGNGSRQAAKLTGIAHPVTGQKAANLAQAPITNNMTSHAMSAGTKTAFSDIENSFQNIKHKTPVNQVRQKQPVTTSNKTLAEDAMKVQQMAACKLQRWYRRHTTRRKTGEAAMRRLLDAKKMEKEEELKRDGDYAASATRSLEEERRRRREELARQARQQAIEELHKKREEKREENRQKAEQEVKYLQASGKITRNPTNKSNLRRKPVKKSEDRRGGRGSQMDSDEELNSQRARPTDGDNTKPDQALEANEVNIHQKSPEHAAGNESAHNVNLNIQGKDAEGAAQGAEGERPASPSQVATKTTFDDLMETLKQLEQEERLPSSRKDTSTQQKNSWLDGIDCSGSDSEGREELTRERLQRLDAGKDNLRKEGLLSEEKIRSIMSFLDEVETADRLSEIDHEMSRVNESLGKPALLVPTAEELQQLEAASIAAAEMTQQMMSQRLDLEEKKRTVGMLQKALNQQRELTVRHARETEKEMKKRLEVQKAEYEETIKRHLAFIDQLIDDKKALSDKCEQLVQEMKTTDKKYSDKVKAMQDSHEVELRKIKDIQAAAEKLRREKWIDEKTKKIKEMTVKGLEPEIQRLIAKHKQEIKKIKSVQEAELLAADERAGQRYVAMTEELRDQLAKEKEAACARERELARQTYEKQTRQEEEAYQQQRRRLYAEVHDEKERLAQQAARQRAELDKLQRQLEDGHSQASECMKREYEKAREEQEKRHQTEVRQLREQLELEKAAWEENLLKKQETWVLQKERELKEQVRRERDREIELVIQRLEQDNQSGREECERVADNRIKRIRDKYESEIRELERSEKQINDKYNEVKARLLEVEGENERNKVISRQKDKEIEELKKLLEKLNQERDRVADVIRQEFADRLVATEEENKRVKNAMSELKARHRLELERAKTESELAQKAKDEEMEEVHKRVKQAILKKEDVLSQLREQYNAAVKRADHLEGLLEQQRKQLLRK